jgi:hypothetical protein
LLREIHGLIGMGDQRIGVRTVGRVNGDADARGSVYLRASDTDWLIERSNDLRGDAGGLGGLFDRGDKPYRRCGWLR